MKIKLKALIFFLMFGNLALGQNIPFNKMNQLLNSQPLSDMLLIGMNFSRVKVDYVSAGYLQTIYASPNKDYNVEIGYTSVFLYCTIYTKNIEYIKQLITDALANNFLNTNKNVNDDLPTLKKGFMELSFMKNGVTYKITLTRSL